MKELYKTQTVQELERELRGVLTLTGLVTDVNTHPGELKNPRNPWCLEYKIRHAEEKKIKKIEGIIDILKGRITNILINNYSEILNIESSYNPRTRIYKESITINSGIQIYDELDFRTRVLHTLIKEIQNYRIRNGTKK